MSQVNRPGLADLHAELCERVGAERVARSLVPGLVRVGNALRADSIHGNTAEGPRQAFSIFIEGDRAGRWRDFGANIGGDLLDLIAANRGTSLADAASYARSLLGSAQTPPQTRKATAQSPRESESRSDAIAAAAAMWESARPIASTPGERYLREARGLTDALPEDVLRYHPRLWHGPTGRQLPAVVAVLRFVQTGEFRGILRLYLDPDHPRKASVERPRSMRGACAGAACILGNPSPIVAICEGLETGLSIQAALGDTVCALAAGNITNMGAIELPAFAERLYDVRDGNPPGSVTDDAAKRSTEKLRASGLPVHTVTPPIGLDCNDLHRTQGLAAVRALFQGHPRP